MSRKVPDLARDVAEPASLLGVVLTLHRQEEIAAELVRLAARLRTAALQLRLEDEPADFLRAR